MSFHSNSPPNYMDGVPVKISEKYKPPPKVTIPQSIVNRLNSEGYPNGIFDYDFTLETNVIKKIEEWKKFRQIERERRQERLRKHEIERAREIEETQKQLLTAVSYPNAEDLSSGDEDESPESSFGKSGGYVEPQLPCSSKQQQEQQQNQQFSPLQQRFDTILMPTVVPDYSTFNSSQFDQINYTTINKAAGKINYSDFENDTSSPFDNIELKTINDLDVLAQVLNVTHVHSNSQINEDVPTPIKEAIEQIHSAQITNKNISNLNNDIYHSSIRSTPSSDMAAAVTVITPPPPLSQWNAVDNSNNINHVVHHSANRPNLFCSTNNYFPYENKTNLQNYANMNGGTDNTTGGIGATGGRLDSNNEQQTQGKPPDFYYNYNNLPSNQNYLYSNYPTEIEKNNLESPNKYPQFQNYNNVQQNFLIQTPLLYHHTDIQQNHQNMNKNNFYNIDSSEIQSAKSKSKSVPDILKELNDEIRDSEMRRARNHSQTLEDHANKISEKNLKATGKRSGTFMNLSTSSQCLVENISSMGFPLERVSKIAEKLGNDDKKIIEHLIPLSELLDLGFDEAKISEALLKFDNNKEKALDFLIS